jgi:hypothetical protein
MNQEEIDLVRQVHKTNYKFYCCLAGGGQTFISNYLSVPGASKNFIYCEIPYGKEGFEKLVGKVDKFVSQEASLKLALTAYEKCVDLTNDKVHSIGVGATCSLATDNERFGREHKAFVTIYSHHKISTTSMVLQQLRFRFMEEEMVKDIIICDLVRMVDPNGPVGSGESSSFILHAGEFINHESALHPS